ncbi:hypothetical protein FRD53_20170, partial [Mycobacterium tuberculosis]
TTLNARDQPPAEVSDQRVSGLTGAVHVHLRPALLHSDLVPVHSRPIGAADTTTTGAEHRRSDQFASTVARTGQQGVALAIATRSLDRVRTEYRVPDRI